MLSKEAQEVIDIINEVKQSPNINKYLEEYEGEKYLPMDNILNGHVENVDEEFIKLMDKLSLVLNGNLITNQGQHSSVFYELKRAGYNFRTGEKDSFGPLTSVYYDRDQDWTVCYG